MKQVIFGGSPTTLLGEEIKVGDLAPDFIAVSQDFSPFKFYESTGSQIKIISVAPSLDTGICSLQTIRFNEEVSKMQDAVALVAITVDLPFAQKRFCGAEGIDNRLVVSDYQKHEFGLSYGFLMENLMLLARGVVVVDGNNKVRYVEVVENVGTHPNYDAALEAVRALL